MPKSHRPYAPEFPHIRAEPPGYLDNAPAGHRIILTRPLERSNEAVSKTGVPSGIGFRPHVLLLLMNFFSSVS
jgi:hypothetical protein